MKVPFNNLIADYKKYQIDYDNAVKEVLLSGRYILGEKVKKFEKELSVFTSTEHCIAVNSGFDALSLSIRALEIKEGEEVIVPANTFIASVLSITENKAKPVFIEPDEFYNINADKIESKISKKTKAIMPVHLYGQACNMDKISIIAQKYNLYIIEDCAQSHGACFNGKVTGSFGDVGCFSFYPTKNLGAFGDGGAIVTNNDVIAKKLRILRNYGSTKKYYHEIEGVNSRLDEIQAALLTVKLSHIDELINERQFIAGRYLEKINNPLVELPKQLQSTTHVWHLFVVKCTNRDLLQNFLLLRSISTQIHYPVPPHLSEAYCWLGYKEGDFPITERYSNTILSLPLFNGMKNVEIDYVINNINEFRGEEQ